ncbi:hypothetical protein Q8W37_19265 [Shimia thalassica]|uniref:hypothetical protein n=1 Tax=Shimia thalassica TaxID=1715693 RepID=UPI0027374D1B|nr:hypothetical protein [Shimia thalassica]MDP2582087.1 hypothetical protein [Shimia thalassica]
MKIEIITSKTLDLFAGLVLRQADLHKRLNAYRAQLDFELDVTRLKSSSFRGDWFTLHDKVRAIRDTIDEELDTQVAVATSAVEISGRAIELHDFIAQTIPRAETNLVTADAVISKAVEIENGLQALGAPERAYVGMKVRYQPAGPNLSWKEAGPVFEVETAIFHMTRFSEGWYLTDLEKSHSDSTAEGILEVLYPGRDDAFACLLTNSRTQTTRNGG